MKLSMWILEDWLTKESPVATIKDGAADIEGARLFSRGQGLAPLKNYVYVGRTKDFFPESGSDEVLLLHANDVIALRSLDLEDVFNQVVAAFEFYNDWESRLFEAAREEDAEQRIIDVCGTMFGPIFLLDRKFNLLAYSREYPVGEVNFIWDEYIQMKSSSLKTIYRMKGSNYVKLSAYKHDLLVYEEPNAAPFSYGIMISYCEEDGSLIGQFTIVLDHPPSICQQQLAWVIKKALGFVHQKLKGGASNYRAQALLLEALNKSRLDSEEQEKLSLLQGWQHLHHICCIVAQAVEETDQGGLITIADRMGESFPNSIVLVHNGRIVCLTTEAEEAIQTKVAQFHRQIPMIYGISRIFAKLEQIPDHYRQALDACAWGSRRQAPINSFDDCGLYVLSHLYQDDYYRACLHPAVPLLLEYDRRHRTELALTLRVFLQEERSPQKTAGRLFVHKNTVHYRIERIVDLCGVDLEDSGVREYLLMSFLALD